MKASPSILSVEGTVTHGHDGINVKFDILQQELHSDYGSGEELRLGYRRQSSTLPPPIGKYLSTHDDYTSLIQSVTDVFLKLTADVRDGVDVMEDMIATGSVRPLKAQNQCYLISLRDFALIIALAYG